MKKVYHSIRLLTGYLQSDNLAPSMAGRSPEGLPQLGREPNGKLTPDNSTKPTEIRAFVPVRNQEGYLVGTRPITIRLPRIGAQSPLKK